MITSTIRLVAPLLLLHAAAAQALVVPAGYAGTEGETRLRFPFHGGTGRGQFVLSRAGLGNLPMFGSFARLALRPDGSSGPLAARSVEISVELSNSFQDWIVDGNMLRHRGPDHAEYFARRSVQLPATLGGGPSATRVPLVLDRPFVYYGDALCLEIACYSTGATPWPLDAAKRAGTGYGTATPMGGSYPRDRNEIGSNALVPWPNGLPVWEVTLNDPSPAGGTAMLLVGRRGGVFGSLFLMGQVVDAHPMAIQDGVTRFLMPAIPDAAALAGESMFLQWIVYDRARRFSLGVSNGLHVTLGRPPLGSAGWTEGDPLSTQIQEVAVGALVVELQ